MGPKARALAHARQLLLVLLGVGLLLTLSGLIVSAIPPEDGLNRQLHKWFHLDREGTIAAWFSSMQWFAAGLAFIVTASHGLCRHLAPPFLFLVGLGFVFLSFDEAIGIHEQITPLLQHVPWMPRFHGDHGIWIWVYLCAAAVMTFIAWHQIRVLLAQFRAEAKIMALGFSTVVVGAAGLEIVSYVYLRNGNSPLLYQAEVAAEEGLEMAGTSILLYGAILFALRAATDGRRPPRAAQRRLGPGAGHERTKATS